MKRFLPTVALLSSLLLGSCACWTAEEKHSKTCIIVKDTIDCTGQEMTKKVGDLYQLVAFLLSGANGGDWMALLASLESTGMDVLTCTAQKVNDDITSGVKAHPNGVAVLSNFTVWKTARLGNVTVKVK